MTAFKTTTSAITTSTGHNDSNAPLKSGTAIVLFLVGIKLLLHLLTATRYGVFSMFYGIHGSYWQTVLSERKGQNAQ